MHDKTDGPTDRSSNQREFIFAKLLEPTRVYEKVNITIRNQPFNDPTNEFSFSQPAIAEEEETVSVVPADTKTGFVGLLLILVRFDPTPGLTAPTTTTLTSFPCGGG